MPIKKQTWNSHPTVINNMYTSQFHVSGEIERRGNARENKRGSQKEEDKQAGTKIRKLGSFSHPGDEERGTRKGRPAGRSPCSYCATRVVIGMGVGEQRWRRADPRVFFLVRDARVLGVTPRNRECPPAPQLYGELGLLRLTPTAPWPYPCPPVSFIYACEKSLDNCSWVPAIFVYTCTSP